MDILDLNGEYIRQLRDSLGWTRAKLSEKTGVPERTIQDIETGVSKNPGIYTIKDLLKGLPNYPDARKNDLIINIQSQLLLLNYNDLDDVSRLINRLISSKPS